MTEEQHEKLSREMERRAREIERNLKPRLEKLSRELVREVAHQAPSPRCSGSAEEMARLGEQMAPSRGDGSHSSPDRPRR